MQTEWEYPAVFVLEARIPHGLELIIDMSPALLGDPIPQPSSSISHDEIGHSSIFEFENRSSHVVKLGVGIGVTTSSEAPIRYSS